MPRGSSGCPHAGAGSSVLTMALTTLQTYTTSCLREQSLDGFSKKYRLLFRISKQISTMSSSNFQVIAREKKKTKVEAPQC